MTLRRGRRYGSPASTSDRLDLADAGPRRPGAVTPRGSASQLPGAALRIRRARLRDAVRVGLTVARANEAEARHERQRVRRVRATCPPRPFRRYLLFVTAVLTAAAAPTWIGTTADDAAVVTVWPLTQPERRRFRRREAAVTATIGVSGGMALLLLGVVHPVLLGAVWASAAAPVAWGAVTAAREGRGTGPLRRRMEAVAAEADGPVYLATGLAGGGRGAGVALVRTLTAWADVEGITLVGRTERGPLVRLYERHGFGVATEAAVWWGTLVLVVRRPAPGAAAGKGGGR